MVMPELPEVETVRIQLLDKVVGKTISEVEVFHSKSIADDFNFEDKLLGKTIAHIDRVGKLMIFSFKKEPDIYMLAHLKMTGQFLYVDKRGEVSGGGHSMTLSDIRELPGRHTRVGFYFTDGSALYFNDMRIFGYIKLADKNGVKTAKSRFGPEPIAQDFDCAWFVAELKKRKRDIKAVLLDQTFVSGLGNIYVDEALFRAKVLPNSKANKLTKKEAEALCVATGEVMKEAIIHKGTTFQHFADTEGERGNFTSKLRVFGRQGNPCLKCGTIIEKTRVAGRGTHFCPKCQK